MRVSMRRSSGRRSWQSPRRPKDEASARMAPALCAQRSAAPRAVLFDPPLYPLRLLDRPMERRGRGIPAAAARGGTALYPGVLARPANDDPDGVAAAGADPY